MKKCRYIITISEFSKQRIMKRLGYPEDKILLVYCGIGEEFYKGQWDEQEIKAIIEKYSLPERYILSLSTLEPRKNLSLLIAAYSRLVLEEKLSVPLVLAGRRGWKIDTLLEDVPSAVKEKIIFTGFIEDEDLPYVYHNAEFFVFPSKYEGFGIPPLEAMACGTPVLSSDAASMPEVLGGAALYFKSGNQSMLESSLLHLSKLRLDERQRMVNEGISQAEKFLWGMEARKLLEFIN